MGKLGVLVVREGRLRSDPGMKRPAKEILGAIDLVQRLDTTAARTQHQFP